MEAQVTQTPNLLTGNTVNPLSRFYRAVIPGIEAPAWRAHFQAMRQRIAWLLLGLISGLARPMWGEPKPVTNRQIIILVFDHDRLAQSVDGEAEREARGILGVPGSTCFGVTVCTFGNP